MKKQQITHIKTVSPSATDNIASGYNVGQWWENTTTGSKFFHKTDGVWVEVGVSGGATNLSNTPSPTEIALNSSTGTGTTLPLANDTNVGLLSPSFWDILNTFASSVRSTILTGISTANATAITATDSVLSAFGKLQAQINLKQNLLFEINDSVPSALVASTTETLIKSYDIGSLQGFSTLKIDIKGRRVGTANEGTLIRIFLKEIGSATRYELGQATANSTATYIPFTRTVAVQPSTNSIEVMSIVSNTVSDFNILSVNFNTVHTIDFTKNYEIQVFGSIAFGTSATWRTYLTNIIKR